MDNVSLFPLFPNLVVRSECEGWDEIKDGLVEWIYNCQRTMDSVNLSNRGGWQSPGSATEDSSFTVYKNYISQTVINSLPYSRTSCRLLNMWVSVNKHEDYNVYHNHPLSDLSGVLWVKAPPNCGSLSFSSPHAFVEHSLLEATTETVKNQQNYYHEYSFFPQEGVMLLFPAHLNHCVEPNLSNQDRISIAFNLEIRQP
jgi:uncharacterized protein (TIGR02466 family)